jgi:hypothetical protein
MEFTGTDNYLELLVEDHHDGEPLENRIHLQCNSPKLTAQRSQVLVLSHCKSFVSSSKNTTVIPQYSPQQFLGLFN